MNIAEIFMYDINVLRYLDEIFFVFFFFYVVLKINKINYQEKKLLFGCMGLLILGGISNIFSGMQNSVIAIVLDIVANFKFPIIIIGFSIMITRQNAEKIIRKLKPLAVAFINIGFVFSIITLFVDTGMRGQQRFGVWGFEFIYKYAHIYSMVLLFFMLVVAASSNHDSRFKRYLVFGLVQLFLTIKGTSMLVVIASLLIFVVMKHKEKFKLWNLVPIGIAGLFVGSYQIRVYFLNNNTPRALLLKYSLKTMADYFPIGSGFATFGSDMAQKYFSKLYFSYGFNNIWGVHEESTFLNDNYWPMVLGQFGIIGTVIVLFMLYQFLKIIEKYHYDRPWIKPMLLVCLFYMVLASLGTTIFTTSATIILGMGMILVIKGCRYEK